MTNDLVKRYENTELITIHLLLYLFDDTNTMEMVLYLSLENIAFYLFPS